LGSQTRSILSPETKDKGENPRKYVLALNIAMAIRVITRRSGLASDGLGNHISPEED